MAKIFNCLVVRFAEKIDCMHFYQDIERDIKSLWNKDLIEEANQLNSKLNGIYFENNVFPMYFNGNIQSNTVLIMLNPGFEDRTFSFFKSVKQQYKKSLEDYLKDYIHSIPFKANEEDEFNRIDNFDTKQAAFLYHFDNKGFELPLNFWKTKGNLKLAKRDQMLNKLQLEFIPYCSKTFKGLFDTGEKAKQNYEFIEKYLLRLLDTIQSFPRENILFCSKQFYFLLQAAAETPLFKDKIVFEETKSLPIGNLNLRFNKVSILYNNQTIKAGIAHSFASQALPNAYEMMAEYGKFCYENLHSNKIS